MVLMEEIVHPVLEKLRSFGQGRLSADEAAAVEEHLADCDSCCLLLEESPADSFVGRLRKAKDLRSADTRINHAGLTPAPADDEPFELADHPRYRVVRLLGQGGMGAVYLAEHRHMGRQVALKVINPDLLNHPRSLPRFQQEVRTAAKLDHPNIVAAYDADHAASLHFLVMEYVEGQNLADYLDEKGPLPVAEACHIIRQAALGLQHAHERGMVHRDIKPHNLMYQASPDASAPGLVKVLDFGLARFAADPCGPNGDNTETMPSNLTGAGAVVGTTDYISPEQAQDAHGADGRADIYSLGCTLYHLLTGKPPFPDGTASEKLRHHAADEPRLLRDQRADVPDGLANVITRMMAKKPDDRYQTSAEVAAALNPFITEPKPKRSKLTRIVALAALVAVVLSCLVAAGVVRIPAGPDREIEIKTDDPNIEVIVKGDRIVRIIDPKTGKAYQLDRHDLTLSLDDPDGLSVTLDGKRPILLKRHGKQIASVRLMKKGEQLASGEEEQAEIRTPLRTGLIRELTWPGGQQVIYHTGLSPDGKYCFATGDAWFASMRVLETATGKEVAHLRANEWGVFLPDSRHLLTPNPDKKLILWDVKTGRAVRQFTGHTDWINQVSLSADGSRALSSDNSGWVRIWHVALGKELLAKHTGKPWCTAALSADGERMVVLFTTTTKEMAICETQTGKVLRSWTVPQLIRAQFLPDGRILTVSEAGIINRWHEDAAAPTQLIKIDGVIQSADLAPDGRRLLIGIVNEKAARLYDLHLGREVGRVALATPVSFRLHLKDGTHGVCLAPMQFTQGAPRICVFRFAPAKDDDFTTQILAPLREGQSALCEERPSKEHVLKALGKRNGIGTDVRIEYEKIVDKLDPVRFYPLAGYARLHRIHWKCTVHYTEITESADPLHKQIKRPRTEVVYIDHDHLHSDPQSETKLQQAKKVLAMAEFYERMHPASATFYYELVCRRYPGTPYAEKAEKRLGVFPPEQSGDMRSEEQSEPRLNAPPVPKITPFRHIKWSEGQANRATISADGRYVMVIRRNVGSDWARVRVWDWKTGKLVFERGAPLARFAPDGAKLIICERWNDMHVYDLATGKKLRHFDADGQMYNFFPSPTGTGLLYLGPTSFQTWDWGTGKKGIQVPWNGVDIVAWAPDDAGHLLVQPNGKAPLHVLSSTTGKKVNAYVQLRDLPTLSSNILNERFLCVDGHKVNVYQKNGEHRIASIDGGPDAGGVISADGTRLLTTGKRRDELCLWDLDNERVSLSKVVQRAHLVARLHLPEAIDVKGQQLSLSRDGQYAFVGAVGDSHYVFRLSDVPFAEQVGDVAPAPEKATEVLRKRWPGREVTSGVDLSPDGRLLISMHWGGVRVWEVATGKVVHELSGWLGVFTPDGKHFVRSTAPDAKTNQLALHETASGKLIRQFGPHPHGIWALSMCPDGKGVVTGGDAPDPVSRYWDLETDEMIASTTGRESAAIFAKLRGGRNRIAVDFKKRTGISPGYFLPGGREVTSDLIEDRFVPVYEISSGKLVRKIPLASSGKVEIIGNAGSTGQRPGRRMAWSLADGTIVVLDLVAGKEVARFPSDIFAPKCLAISADGRIVAACASNEKSEVVVWRLPEPSQHVAKVRKMASGSGDEQSEPPPEAPSSQPSWADKLFLAKGKTNHNFGTAVRGSLLKHRFHLKNIYTVPLEIINVRVSAGAITCKESTKVLKPGEEAYIEVHMDTRRFTGPKTMSIFVTVGSQYVSTATLQVTAVSRDEEDLGQESAFFNGKNLFGWQGLPGYWKVHNGAIVGAPANGVKAHTFLCSEKIYRDFELKFKVKRKGGIGNSGVQIRSTLFCPKQFVVTGPQIEIDSANFRLPPGSIVTEPVGNPLVKANAKAVGDVWKDDGFNDMTIRCVGKWVTVTINGVEVLDTHFPSMPAEGIIAWQLHGGFGEIASPEEVIFKDIRFTDLSERPTSGYTPLFNGRDLTGWKTHPDSPGDWRVEHGVLVGRGPTKNSIYTESGHYEDFHLRAEVKINAGGNSGLQFRKSFTSKASFDGYEAQIDCDNHPARTGSLFVKGGTATVKIDRSPVPVDTWFSQEVIARGNHIVILVNGKKVVDHVDHDRTWQRGHLALQLFEPETVVRFRKIEVKRLAPSSGNEAKSIHLFNGNMTGWVREGGTNAWNEAWAELIGSGNGYPTSGFLLSPKSYSNYRLRFQYQLSAGANSGVALRAVPGETVQGSKVPQHLEVQILDDAKYRRADGTMDCPTGSLFWCGNGGAYLRPERPAHFKAPSSWNEMEIELRGQSLQVWVNGQLVQNTDLSKLAAQSDALPGLKRTAGRIGFQQHTGEVRFRNIQIEELSGPEASGASTSGYRGLPAPDAIRLPSKRC